jgi:hypothetical protein
MSWPFQVFNEQVDASLSRDNSEGHPESLRLKEALRSDFAYRNTWKETQEALR